MRRSGLILGIFVLSGAAGLVYEVVWSRQLVLVFGNTTQAVATILTGFFGGMAIGSFLGGRLADRVRSPLRLYGVLELILVVVVILTPITFRLLHEVYRAAFGGLETQPALLALVRFGLALLALAPATVLMGATLPTLTRYLSGDQHLSRAFSRLYAANTFGAILGTIAAGFFLIELLGLTGTLLVGAACSGIAGVAALVIDRRRAAAEAGIGARPPASPGVEDARADASVDEPPGTRAGPAPAARARSWPSLVAFVSGPDVARLPDPLDPAAVLGDRQLDLRLQLDPRDLPDRARPRRDASTRSSGRGSPARSCSSRSPRSSSPLIAVSGLVLVIGHPAPSSRRRRSRRSGRSSGRWSSSSCRRRSSWA